MRETTFKITIAKVKAKKFMKFLLTLPLIILGTGSYCKGVWNELSNQRSEK